MGAVRRGKGEESALAKHHIQIHPGIPPVYTGKLVGGDPKNLYRYVGEALHIERRSKDRRSLVLNGKGEWGRMHLPRLGLVEEG